MAANTGQTSPDDDWLSKTMEDALEPGLPIVDPHHHLWLRNGYTYLMPELAADLDCGHNVVATVFAECHSMYREKGPEAERSLGETEFVTGQAAMSTSGAFGPTRACAVMFGNVDMTLGAAIEPLLDRHIEASGARFRGVRYSTGWDADERIRNVAPDAGMLVSAKAREAAGVLARRACLSTAGSIIRNWTRSQPWRMRSLTLPSCSIMLAARSLAVLIGAGRTKCSKIGGCVFFGLGSVRTSLLNWVRCQSGCRISKVTATWHRARRKSLPLGDSG